MVSSPWNSRSSSSSSLGEPLSLGVEGIDHLGHTRDSLKGALVGFVSLGLIKHNQNSTTLIQNTCVGDDFIVIEMINKYIYNIIHTYIYKYYVTYSTKV